jgi:hypothetical protein
MNMLTPSSQVPLRPEQLEHGLAASSNEEVPSVPITMIAADPADLECRWGIRFDDSFDNMDYVKVAVVQLRDGPRLTLLFHLHRGSPLAKLAANLDLTELFQDYPRLTVDDVKACLTYAQELVAKQQKATKQTHPPV